MIVKTDVSYAALFFLHRKCHCQNDDLRREVGRVRDLREHGEHQQRGQRGGGAGAGGGRGHGAARPLAPHLQHAQQDTARQENCLLPPHEPLNQEKNGFR